jgi:hypothetical protein
MIAIDAFNLIQEPGSKDWILSNVWDKYDDKLYAEVLRQKELKKKREFIKKQEILNPYAHIKYYQKRT